MEVIGHKAISEDAHWSANTRRRLLSVRPSCQAHHAERDGQNVWLVRIATYLLRMKSTGEASGTRSCIQVMIKRWLRKLATA